MADNTVKSVDEQKMDQLLEEEKVLLIEEKELTTIVPGLVAIIGGMICTIMISVPIEILLPVGAWIAAPIAEEPAKMIGLLFLALWMPSALRTKKDGLVLGALAGLGFTFLENTLYLVSGVGGPIMIYRTLVDSPGHIMWSAIVGMGVVLAARKIVNSPSNNPRDNWKLFLSADVLSFLAVGMVLHGLFDFFAPLSILLSAGITILSFYIVYRLYRHLPDQMSTVKFTNPASFFMRAMAGLQPFPHPTVSAPPVAAHQFCGHCGAHNKPGAAFCSDCGQKL